MRKEVKQYLFSPRQHTLLRSTAKERIKEFLFVFLCTISCLVGVKNNHSIPQKVWLFIQSFTIMWSVSQAYPGVHKGESDMGFSPEYRLEGETEL